jgi:hypothetical protein
MLGDPARLLEKCVAFVENHGRNPEEVCNAGIRAGRERMRPEYRIIIIKLLWLRWSWEGG